MKLLTIRENKTRRIIATYLIPNDLEISNWAYKKVEVRKCTIEKVDFPLTQLNSSTDLEDELYNLFKSE
jgi:hypothetical protein